MTALCKALGVHAENCYCHRSYYETYSFILIKDAGKKKGGAFTKALFYNTHFPGSARSDLRAALSVLQSDVDCICMGHCPPSSNRGC